MHCPYCRWLETRAHVKILEAKQSAEYYLQRLSNSEQQDINRRLWETQGAVEQAWIRFQQFDLADMPHQITDRCYPVKERAIPQPMERATRYEDQRMEEQQSPPTRMQSPNSEASERSDRDSAGVSEASDLSAGGVHSMPSSEHEESSEVQTAGESSSST